MEICRKPVARCVSIFHRFATMALVSAFTLTTAVIANPSEARAEDIVPLELDQEAVQARVDVIQRAKEELLIEYFYVGGDDYSLGGMSLVVDAARRGVKVKLMLDSVFGKIPLALYTRLMDSAIGPDGKQNLEIKIYNPMGLNPFNWSNRNHAKMLIADQNGARVLVTGGRNVGGEYFGTGEGKSNFDDFDVLVRGAVAEAARENFYANWDSRIGKHPSTIGTDGGKADKSLCNFRDDTDACLRAADMLQKDMDEQEARLVKIFDAIVNTKPGDKIISKSDRDWFAASYSIKKVRFMSHDPTKLVSRGSATLSRDLLEILKTAKSDVNIISPYLIPTDNVFKAFEELKARGVKIRIITNSMKSTDNLLAQAGYRSSQSRLTKMGIEIWEYKGPHTVHAKTAIIDHQLVIVGTYNMDPRSAFLNREVALGIYDDENSGFAAGHEKTIEAFRERSMLVAKDGEVANLEWQKEGVDFMTASKIRILRILMPFIKFQL